MEEEHQKPLSIHHGAASTVHDALNRMKRAHERRTGCHLTAEMIEAFALTFMSELWGEEDPRKATRSQA